MKTKIAIKVIAFALIFIAVISVISQPLIKIEWSGDEIIGSFYEEENDSLDAVYIGSSNCFTFWNSLLAWKNYGITIHPYSSDSNSFLSTEYLIAEARKTQPNALYVVNINTVSDSFSVQGIRNLIDCMPMSLNKLRLINHICTVNGYSFEESLEFYLPIVRFHSRWSELEEKDFNNIVNRYKGATIYSNYLKKQSDVSSAYVTSDNTSEMSEILYDTLSSLLDYCDEENVKILFVTVPQARDKEKSVNEYNSINAYVSSRGYDFIDFINDEEESGISFNTDFYNKYHTNIHGSIKFTNYLSEYLIEKYGFSDKRNDENYSSWNECLETYSEKISPYILDFEADFADRNYTLNQPVMKITENSGKAKLTWTAIDGVDGYVVYRKSGTSAWKKIKDTDTISLTVDVPEKGSVYYTVVPYTVADGEYSYGNFSYTGIKLSGTE